MSTFVRPIKNCRRYGIGEDGYVYNQVRNTRLKRQWYCGRYFTVIETDSGKPYRFYHDQEQLGVVDDESISDLSPPPDEIRVIPDFINYGITHYGAVWRLTSPLDRMVRPKILDDHVRRRRRYVVLRDKFGKKHPKRVDKLLEQVWGDEATVTIGLTES